MFTITILVFPLLRLCRFPLLLLIRHVTLGLAFRGMPTYCSKLAGTSVPAATYAFAALWSLTIFLCRVARAADFFKPSCSATGSCLTATAAASTAVFLSATLYSCFNADAFSFSSCTFSGMRAYARAWNAATVLSCVSRQACILSRLASERSTRVPSG